MDSATTAAALAPFTGAYQGLDGLLAAGDALERELQLQGHTFHRVVLSPQTLDSGTVVLQVVQFTLADVKISGNEHYSDANVQRSLRDLRRGEVPNTRRLSRVLSVANQHPAKHLRLNFAQSETEADALDANISVQDRRPWQLFAAFNNIGTDETGNTRLSLGAQYANLFGRDHVFTGTFTTSPDNSDDVTQFGFNYQLPVYALNGWLSGFYVQSDVDIGQVQDFFDISGAGDFGGLSFRHEFLRRGAYRHGITLGIQDRNFDTKIFNAATGGQINSISTQVRSRPVSVRYDGSYAWTRTAMNFFVEYVHNIAFGGHNRDLDYERVRRGADADWKLIRFAASASRQLPKGFFAIANMSGQYADTLLIPGEQFGLGGSRSVRGFEEHTVSGDDALQLNFELWTPPVRWLKGATLLAYADVGHKHVEEPVEPQRRSDTLSSVGVGARWQWRDRFILALDYGKTLAEADGEAADRGNVKWHLDLQYRF